MLDAQVQKGTPSEKIVVGGVQPGGRPSAAVRAALPAEARGLRGLLGMGAGRGGASGGSAAGEQGDGRLLGARRERPGGALRLRRGGGRPAERDGRALPAPRLPRDGAQRLPRGARRLAGLSAGAAPAVEGAPPTPDDDSHPLRKFFTL